MWAWRTIRLTDMSVKTRVVDPWVGAIAGMALVVCLTGCDRVPTAPSPPTQPPAGPGGTLRVFGQVRDEADKAVAGARVVAFHVDGESEAVSDADGAYALTVPLKQISVSLKAEMAEFEPSRASVFLSLNNAAVDVRRDLRLHKIVRVNAGASVDVSIRADDPVCAGVHDDLEWPCRRVRVVSEFAGRLTVVPALDAATSGVGPAIQMQVAAVPYGFPPSALSVFVAAGSETIVEFLLLQRDSGRTMTVHTAISR